MFAYTVTLSDGRSLSGRCYAFDQDAAQEALAYCFPDWSFIVIEAV